MVPNDSNSWSLLGIILKELNKFTDSEEAFKKALDLNPNEPNIYYNMALLYVSQNKIQETISNLEKCFQMDKNDQFKDIISSTNAFDAIKDTNDFKSLFQ